MRTLQAVDQQLQQLRKQLEQVVNERFLAESMNAMTPLEGATDEAIRLTSAIEMLEWVLDEQETVSAIRVQHFIGCKPSPYESMIEARDLFEQFVNGQRRIRRMQIISISTGECIWLTHVCHTITMVYEEENERIVQ